MVLDRFTLSDGLAAVQVDADRVKEGEDCNNGEGTSDYEGDKCRLGTEVEEGGCNCADVD